MKRKRKTWVYDLTVPGPIEVPPQPDGALLYIFKMFDCDGMGYPSEGAKKVIRTTDKLKLGYTDHRDLRALQEGCCPPALMKDFILQEGAIVERDPVEEAMKLHARGYFGGGG
jgi:hypothetical protein